MAAQQVTIPPEPSRAELGRVEPGRVVLRTDYIRRRVTLASQCDAFSFIHPFTA